jgi:hypothetical protein
MRFFSFLLFSVFLNTAIGQKPQFKLHNLSLPAEIAYFDNQFSGLYIADGKLFLMSESRLQDKAEGKLYAISLSDLNLKIADSTYKLSFRKYHLHGLEILRDKINAAGQEYEGLEAMVIDNKDIYFTVETETASSNGYLLKGQLNDTAVMMDTDFLQAIPKPVTAGGSQIYNAGFEALALKKGKLIALFEYNFFSNKNFAYQIKKKNLPAAGKIVSMPIHKIPFRVTDITRTGKKHFTAINYFFKGGGADTVYRIPADDVKNNSLIKNSEGYQSYTRLIDLSIKRKKISWKPLWEFPTAFMNYNWEGIAAYDYGYFILNDKYTPAKPYISTLLYLQKIN